MNSRIIFLNFPMFTEQKNKHLRTPHQAYIPRVMVKERLAIVALPMIPTEHPISRHQTQNLLNTMIR